MRRCDALAALLIALPSWLTVVRAAEPSASPIGKQVGEIALPDQYGKVHSLSDHKGRVVVLAFLGTECPLAKSYAPRLRDLAKDFADAGVAFLGIDSNQQDTLTEIANFTRAHEVQFPVLKDLNNVVADAVGAQRTPEVFVLDREHKVRYWGRIDDQYGVKTGGNYARPKLNERNLADALTAVVAGKEVAKSIVPAEGCLIGRVAKVEPHGDVTYTKHVSRILQDRCVECHRPNEVGPFSLTSYDDTLGWAAMIAEVVREGRMPPWFANSELGHFANDTRLTNQEKQDLLAWIDNGCPQGNPQDLPEPRKYVDGWRMGQPDQVLNVSDKPFEVPATGLVPYQFFTADPGWTEDKWIQAVEVRAGNRAVVHHINMTLQVASNPLAAQATSGLAQYTPGTPPFICPEGTALKIPAGAKLRFEIHYTANGTPQTDLSMVGFKFVDPASVKKQVRAGTLANLGLQIPANDPNFETTASRVFRTDTLLYTMMPHMHLRGKAFKLEAQYPDGTHELLLDVPNYDFNWQLVYRYKEPKLLPAGTTLKAWGRFDNSADNPANPDPDKVVRWGQQTFDEMFAGVLSTIDADPPAAKVESPAKP